MKNKHGLIIVILLGLTIGFLCGCTNNGKYVHCNYDLKYGSFCSSARQKSLANKLRHQGAQVSYFGDYIYIIFPSKMLFMKGTADLGPKACNRFNLITAFLRCYQKITVRVIGFATPQEKSGCNVSLAHQQAQKVVNNLWQRQIDARLMYSSGRRAKTVAKKEYQSNRIEIVTKRLP
ncbi:MAG: OmpA family protein [Gammaproteobacteria bacterium]|jgi:outer membrane protein OmpA-like peptidoglycan-associated protein